RGGARERELMWVVCREPQGWALTASETSGTVWVRTLADGTLVRKLDGHSAPISGIAMSPDGSALACGVIDGSLHMWDLDSGKRLWQVTHHEAKLGVLAFLPDGSLVATGGEDGRVCVIAAKNGTLVKLFKGH